MLSVCVCRFLGPSEEEELAPVWVGELSVWLGFGARIEKIGKKWTPRSAMGPVGALQRAAAHCV